VILEGLSNPHYFFSRRIARRFGDVRIVLGNAKASDDRVQLAVDERGVVDEEEAIVDVVRVERHTQQSTLRHVVSNESRQIDERTLQDFSTLDNLDFSA